MRALAVRLGLAAVLLGCAGERAAAPPPSKSRDPVLDRIIRQSVAKALNTVTLPAVREGKVLWSYPAAEVLNNNVLDMKLLGRDRLLVVYDARPPILVDAVTGAPVWDGEDTFGKITEEPSLAGAFSFAAAAGDTVALRMDRRAGTELVGLDVRAGKVVWRLPVPEDQRLVVHPSADPGLLVLHAQDDSSGLIQGIRAGTGEAAWQREYRNSAGLAEPRSAISSDGSLVAVLDGLEALSPVDGSTRWTQPEIRVVEASPRLQLADGRIHLVDGEGNHVVLDGASGRRLATVPLPRDVLWTNVFPTSGGAYLRGIRSASGTEAPHRLVAIKDDRLLWESGDDEPIVSNLVEAGSRVYYGTYTSLVGLDASTGRRVFKEVVASLGRGFPVRLRATRRGIVHIGELAIVGCDRTTGKPFYRHGFTPVSELAHLDALDDYIQRTEDAMKWFKGVAAFQGTDWSGAARASAASAAYYQDLSVQYHNQAVQESQKAGNTRGTVELRTSQNLMRAATEAWGAQFQAQLGLAFSIADNVRKASLDITRENRILLARLLRTRRALLASYGISQPRGHEHRAVSTEQASGIAVVDLDAGTRALTMLSARLKEIGLFQVVDVDRRIVFSHALRMLPESDQKPEERSAGRARYVVSLVAQPVALR